MPNRFRSWKSLLPEHRDYVFIYAWGVVWAIAYYLYTPTTTLLLFNKITVTIICLSALVGGLVAIYGLLTRNNLLIERAGVTTMLGAPISYALTQLGLFIASVVDPADFITSPGGSPTDRIPVLILGFWSFWWLNKRRRQLTTQLKAAKAAPLMKNDPLGETPKDVK